MQLDLVERLSPPEQMGGSMSEEKKAKTSDALRTISEVADDLGIPQHVLRFWESKFPQISPLKRRGGRRYYRPRDIETVRQIKILLYDEGYTIKGALKMIRRRMKDSEKSEGVIGSSSNTSVSSQEKPIVKTPPPAVAAVMSPPLKPLPVLSSRPSYPVNKASAPAPTIGEVRKGEQLRRVLGELEELQDILRQTS